MDLGWGSLSNLARIRDYKSRRLSSWDRSGGNMDAIHGGARRNAPCSARSPAPAACKHIWMTMASLPAEPHDLRQTVLRMFWDGEASPSVEVPLGDFFGIGFGLRRNFVSLPLQMSPQDGRGFNCWFPMPFADGARFEVENQGAQQRIFFFYIDYEEHARDRRRPRPLPRLVEPHQPDRRHGARARLHARATTATATRGRPAPASASAGRGSSRTSPARATTSSSTSRGNGHYVGCNLNIDVFERQVNDWYGEGDDMIFIDGEPWPPRLHGTGTEDYFNTAFCPTQEYCAPYHGITVYSGTEAWPWGGKNSMYRFHIEDPIRFERSIRVTIETGHDNALANDYSSTAYWYQLGRTAPLPPLPPVEDRLPRPEGHGMPWPWVEGGPAAVGTPPPSNTLACRSQACVWNRGMSIHSAEWQQAMRKVTPAADKREAILAAALDLFNERSFNGTPMPLVAERAGVGAGTIYRYFESKEALGNVVYRDLQAGAAAPPGRARPSRADAAPGVPRHVARACGSSSATTRPRSAFSRRTTTRSYLDADERRDQRRRVRCPSATSSATGRPPARSAPGDPAVLIAHGARRVHRAGEGVGRRALRARRAVVEASRRAGVGDAGSETEPHGHRDTERAGIDLTGSVPWCLCALVVIGHGRAHDIEGSSDHRLLHRHRPRDRGAPGAQRAHGLRDGAAARIDRRSRPAWLQAAGARRVRRGVDAGRGRARSSASTARSAC